MKKQLPRPHSSGTAPKARQDKHQGPGVVCANGMQQCQPRSETGGGQNAQNVIQVDSAALGKHLNRTTNNCTITSAADREKVEELGLQQCSEGDRKLLYGQLRLLL